MPLESAITASAPPDRTAGQGAPRIYYVHPLLAGPLDGWGPVLDRAAALGFDHVLTAPLFAAGAARDLFLTADPDRIDPRLGGGDGWAAIARLAADCEARGLRLMQDATLDRAAAGGSMPDGVFAQPDASAALDPRAIGSGALDAAARTDGDAFAAWWAARLDRLASAGVGAVRLLGLASVPAQAVRAIARGMDRGPMLLGWTPGMPAQARAKLAGAGLDFVFSSLPWWDFDADWYWDEAEALARIAPVIAAPEAPFGARLATRCHDPAALDACYRRAAGFAAATGRGWMMPMGFEVAAARMMGMHDAAADWQRLTDERLMDLAGDIARMNAARVAQSGLHEPALLGASQAPVLALARADQPDPRRATRASITLVNTSLDRRNQIQVAPLLARVGLVSSGGAGDAVVLEPGEVAVIAGEIAPAFAAVSGPPSAEQAVRAPRIAIEAITPSVDDGLFPARRTVGETVTVEADVIVDGHDQLAVALLWRGPGEEQWRQTAMRPLGNDRWRAAFPLPAMGTYQFTIEAWRDAFATFRDELAKKRTAGIDVSLERREGLAMVAQADAALARRIGAMPAEQQGDALLSDETATVMTANDRRPFGVRWAPPLQVAADRTAAGFASWYEIFPRSMSDDAARHGNFADVERHLPRIRDMGFDVLYFPPIHPIGRTNRKGRNNSLTPAPDDPGSPYAIGSAEGGHESLHPELGTFDDFRRLREAAAAHGLEIAIDFAIQCAPDHPWLTEHKDWFAWRPDGSIRYAENPPKKYEDIVNVDFYAPGAMPGLWEALANAVLFWAERGVRLFRVDNPHTKPFPFWQWLIGEVRARYPDAVFLAEAFTRPKVMNRLGKIGFGQSYTYFTWRNTKSELAAYFTELETVQRDYLRPHLFVNTPDINPVFLQESGRAGFLIRAALAATLSGLWGVYCGFELCEAAPLPGREEYMDSEKYQLRAWDWDRPGNITAEISQLNRIRRMNPALHSHLGVTFHAAYDDAVLWYSKAAADGGNTLLIAVSLDPRATHDAAVELPLWQWGLPNDGALEMSDLLAGTRSVWRGKAQRITLSPDAPYAIWRARPTL